MAVLRIKIKCQRISCEAKPGKQRSTYFKPDILSQKLAQVKLNRRKRISLIPAIGPAKSPEPSYDIDEAMPIACTGSPSLPAAIRPNIVVVCRSAILTAGGLLHSAVHPGNASFNNYRLASPESCDRAFIPVRLLALGEFVACNDRAQYN